MDSSSEDVRLPLGAPAARFRNGGSDEEEELAMPRRRRAAREAADRIRAMQEDLEHSSGEDERMDEEAGEAERDVQPFSPIYCDLNKRLTALEGVRRYVKRDVSDTDVIEDDTPTSEVTEQRLDFVELSETRKHGAAAYDRLYPHRHALMEQGELGSEKRQRYEYARRLQTIEERWTEVCHAFGMPPVLIRDWSSLPPADDELDDLKFTQRNVVSDAVKQLLLLFPPVRQSIRCDSECLHCSATPRLGAQNFCCSMTSHIKEDHGGMLSFVNPNDAEDSMSARVECTAACGCDPLQCTNRSVQRGRQHPVLLFRDCEVGWSLRTITEIEENQVICEYIGQIVPERSIMLPESNYEFEMGLPMSRLDGKKRPLIVSAYETGNEGRYLAHACQPTAVAESTVINREGLYMTSIAFKAVRLIRRGEALTFDYFPSKSASDHDRPWLDMFEYCRCGHAQCRFSEKIVQELQRAETKNAEDGQTSPDVAHGQEANETMMEVDEPGPSRRRQHGAIKTMKRRSSGKERSNGGTE